MFPWPLCTGSATANCCKPGAKNDITHCPVFPGAGGTTLEAKQPAPLRRLKPQALQRFMSQQGSPAGLLQATHDGAPSVATDDPTRKIRQEMTELVFRNEPMFKYILDMHDEASEANLRLEREDSGRAWRAVMQEGGEPRTP